MTKFSGFALVLVALAITACGDTHLLSGRSAPDELAVVEGPSLALPPDFELRPPQEGREATTVPLSDKPIDARTLLTKEGAAPASAAQDSADAWLVKAAGGDKADPAIREKLSDKPVAVEEEKEKKGFFSRLNPFADDDAE